MLVDETVFSPMLDAEDVGLLESYHNEDVRPGTGESCIKLEDA